MKLVVTIVDTLIKKEIKALLTFCRLKATLLLLLMLIGVKNVAAQEPVGVQTVEAGKPYRIRTTMIEGMQLSTKENTVRNVNPAIGIFMTDYFAKDQIFYFEATSTNYFIKDAEGKYVNSDGFKTYAGNFVDDNKHKYAIEPVSGTNYVKFKCAGSNYLAPGRGFVNGSPVYGDGDKDRHNTNTKTIVLWKIIPWDPVADFKVLIDAVAAYKDNDATLGTAYNAAVATYESYKNTSITDMLADTEGALTAVANGISDLTTARDTYLNTLSSTVGTYNIVNVFTGKALTYNNNTSATLSNSNATASQMTLEKDGNYYYIKNNDRYLSVKGTRVTTPGSNYDNNDNKNVLTLEWKTAKDNTNKLNLKQYGNGQIGIQFNLYQNSSYTGGYLDLGPCTDMTTLYPLRESGISNPMSYWVLFKEPEITFNADAETATIESLVPAATVYYKLNDAADFSVYSGGTIPLTPDAINTLQAYAVLNGIQSSTAEASINLKTSITAPTVTAEGSIASISSEVGTDIYYTLDGTDPTTSSTPYTGSFNLTEEQRNVIKAIAVGPKGTSAVATSYVDLRTSLPKPVISLNAEKTEFTITHTDGAADDRIFYTLDGTAPTTSSTPYITGPVTIDPTSVDKIKAIAFNAEGNLNSSIATKYVNGYEPKYIAIHKQDVGYLKINSANISLNNDGTFRYGNAFDDNGASIWVLTEEGYLKNQYYYLNVAGTTPYLSVDPVTNWELEEIDDNGKMSIKYNDLYLASSSGIKLVNDASIAYHACPITITEKSWTGPSTDAVTVQSPQQITYLRHFYTQKMDYTFINDDGETKTESDKDRRIYAMLSHDDADDIEWAIVDGVIYNKKASGNVDVTATYSVSSSDPLANQNHTPDSKSIKMTVQQKIFASNDSKNYLLFSIKGGDSDRLPYDDVNIAVNNPVMPNGQAGSSSFSLVTDPDISPNQHISWKIVADEMGFYTFQNVSTGRYLYFDGTPTGSSDFGELKVGATTLPAGEGGNKYKFKFFKAAKDGTFGDCYNFIPYSRIDAVYKSDGLASSLYATLNNANYKTSSPKVISLFTPGNSTWRIYEYKAVWRIRPLSELVISGQNTVNALGEVTLTSNQGWYGKYIDGSPSSGNSQKALLVNGTYNTDKILYHWKIEDLDGYVSIDGGTNNDGVWSTNIEKNQSMTFTVTALPSVVTSGTISLEWRGGVNDQNSADRPYRWSGWMTFPFTIQGDGSIVLTDISTLEEISDVNGAYRLTGDIIDASDRPSVTTFSGVLDGNGKTISGLNAPLFTTLSNGVVRNLNLSDVDIEKEEGHVGAIAATANGSSRIYNVGILGGTLKTSSAEGNYCGGLVGLLDGYSRVINCFSYADITGGHTVGGIVGYNNYASTSIDLRTMVMNCMFYGNATGGNVAPIYNGKIINNNSATGLNNFNYFSFEDFTSSIDTYNCALGAEKRFLTRFEFYRQILNSNRELATWYINGSAADSRTIMEKWVLDKTIKPYPILKPGGKYPSIINYDAEAGKSLGTLSVTISGTGNNAPSDATINTGSLTLTRTDKDTVNYNFNYDKVQLPYYNDVGTGNYTDNKVVVGWEITAITGNGTTSFSTGTDVTMDGENNVTATPYNFADRNCTEKDLYATSGRVFSQGAYFDVPNGVTAITIQPHWAKAVYLADPCYDKTYTKDFSNNNGNATDITTMGTRYTNGEKYLINGSSQKVYTTMGNAITALGRPSGSSVYEYAVVLVGNYHHYYGNSSIINDKNGFTIMSADLDGDNEPDNCFIYQHTNRQPVSPIRFDFLCWSGIGMAQKPSNSTRMPDIGIFKPRGWFEVTNTCLTQFHQFEYDWSTKDADQDGSPLILLGGIYEQFVSSNNGAPTHTKYIHLGSNAWFKMFNNGIHADWSYFTPHKPISVTGGDYDLFYLSGMFRPDATANEDHAECYISGGYFGEVAGAGMEKINGDVYWQIDHADIEAFYGGGINAAQPVQGDITTDITNSNVTTFCGGPKFGDMVTGKKVTTTASGCTFGQYFGAGYGGTSLNRIRKYNLTDSRNYNFNSSWVSSYSRAYETSTKTTPNGTGGPTKDITVNAIATNYEYELFPFSGFADDNNVGRFYVNYASLSLATTRNVTSTLTGCKITGNFYGGGSLGKVDGDVNSTLKDCTVHGNVFGAGFSATAPTVDVFPKQGFTTEPQYDGNSGTYTQGVYPEAQEYTWSYTTTPVATGNEFDEEHKYILTNVNFPEEGGTVTGNVTLNITGSETIITGDVYGGGALADSNTDYYKATPVTSTISTINLTGGRINGNVYGGGKGSKDVAALVGNTLVNLNENVENSAKGCIVDGIIFGCNNINGTPKGNATVHIYKTQNAAETKTVAKQKGRYDLTAVYGGGNLAPFIPTAADASTYVIIDGCDLTSIQTVYGGGNAASTPATNVTVNGTYEINELFGGGNGKDLIPQGGSMIENPGANVGYYNYSTYNTESRKWVDNDDAKTKEQRTAAGSPYVYGSGTVSVSIYGGTIHQVYGGSNTKGNVRVSAVTRLDDNNECDFNIDKAYGGGRSAPMDGEAQLLLACIPGLKAVYGGAEEANIEGNVTLNITNGTYDRVFGGNNISGTIGGTITVNIEETGCRPVIIGQLYGGGNQASYEAPFVEGSDTERLPGPTINVRSFTSIGEVYGGGYGKTAKVTGDTHVNINVSKGLYATEEFNGNEDRDPADVVNLTDSTITRTIQFVEYLLTEDDDFVLDEEGNKQEVEQTIQVKLPIHPSSTDGTIGAIMTVYGGGNAAPVEGNTFVNIGTMGTQVFATPTTKTVEGVETATTDEERTKVVEGANIRGNVFGGGKLAKVSGNTNVVIGR